MTAERLSKKQNILIDVGAILDSTLPDLLRPHQLLEIGRRNHLQVFQEAEHPYHLLGHLARHGIEKILDGAFSVRCSVKEDRSVHDMDVNLRVNLCQEDFSRP